MLEVISVFLDAVASPAPSRYIGPLQFQILTPAAAKHIGQQSSLLSMFQWLCVSKHLKGTFEVTCPLVHL